MGTVLKEQHISYKTLVCSGLFTTNCTATDIVGNNGITAKSMELFNIQDLSKAANNKYNNLYLKLKINNLQINGEKITWNKKMISKMKQENRKHLFIATKQILNQPSVIETYIKTKKNKENTLNLEDGFQMKVGKNFIFNIGIDMNKPTLEKTVNNLIIKKISINIKLTDNQLSKLFYASYLDNIDTKTILLKDKTKKKEEIVKINTKLGFPKISTILPLDKFKKGFSKLIEKDISKTKQLNVKKGFPFLNDAKFLIKQGVDGKDFNMNIEIINKKDLNIQNATGYVIQNMKRPNVKQISKLLKVNIK